MTASEIMNKVLSTCDMMDVPPSQHVSLQRYFLHKGTTMTIEEIADMTGTNRIKVYDSIYRMANAKRLEKTKAMIFAAIK